MAVYRPRYRDRETRDLAGQAAAARWAKGKATSGSAMRALPTGSWTVDRAVAPGIQRIYAPVNSLQ